MDNDDNLHEMDDHGMLVDVITMFNDVGDEGSDNGDLITVFLVRKSMGINSLQEVNFLVMSRQTHGVLRDAI